MAKRKSARRWGDVIVVLVFFVGLVIFAYPFVANAINDISTSLRARQDKQLAEANVKREAAAQKRRNKELAEQGLMPNADALRERSATSKSAAYRAKHLIGTVNMPSIRSETLLYDVTNEALLQSGATVLPGTSYPTGGKGNHTVISAHSGIPGKQLFSRLERLKRGDVFVLTVGKQKLAYKVFRRQTVKPQRTDVLRAEPGRDLATLMTCTPIGVNSHRFLVTGYRVPYTERIAKQVQSANRHRHWLQVALIGAAVLAVLGCGWFVIRAIRRHRQV